MSATLMGLPTELRLKIIEDVLQPLPDIQFEMYNNIDMLMSEGLFPGRILDILLVNRDLYEETTHLLYRKMVVTVWFQAYDTACTRRQGTSSKYTIDTAFWRRVENLTMQFDLLDVVETNPDVLVKRLRHFIAVSMAYGQYLRTLNVVFFLLEVDATPYYFKEVTDALEMFVVEGMVKVEISAHATDHGEEYVASREDVCAVLERRIADPRRRRGVNECADEDQCETEEGL